MNLDPWRSDLNTQTLSGGTYSSRAPHPHLGKCTVRVQGQACSRSPGPWDADMHDEGPKGEEPFPGPHKFFAVAFGYRLKDFGHRCTYFWGSGL